MHCFILVLALAVVALVENVTGQAAGAPAAETPPTWDKFRSSRSCQKSLGRCFKQLGTKLKDSEPHMVEQCNPCKECEAQNLGSIGLLGEYTRLCCADTESDKITYNLTACFQEPLVIKCKECVVKSATGDEIKGDMTMNWADVTMFVIASKPVWSGTKTNIASVLLRTEPTDKTVTIECEGDKKWQDACVNAHKLQTFIGICQATAKSLFPTASNTEFKKQEDDENDGLGAMMKCSIKNDLPGTKSEEDLYTLKK